MLFRSLPGEVQIVVNVCCAFPKEWTPPVLTTALATAYPRGRASRDRRLTLLRWTKASTDPHRPEHFCIEPRKRACREPALARLQLVPCERLPRPSAPLRYAPFASVR